MPRVSLALLFILSTLSAVASPDLLPDLAALGPWQNRVPLVNEKFSPLKLICGKNLYPTQPQQILKVYHVDQWAQYQESKLEAKSETCVLGSKYSNAQGRFACLRADVALRIVLSDTYQDACGNLYRGFVEKVFLRSQDNMGTLFSPGRTLYENLQTKIPGDTTVGSTYAVAIDEFSFLSALFPGDLEKIELLKNQASQTHQYNSESHLFNKVAH